MPSIRTGRTMTEPSDYVPVLLTKRGERGALTDLPAGSKATMKPLFVIEPIPWDYEEERPSKSIDQHLGNKAGQLAESWGRSEAFVDCMFLDDTPLASGDHPLVGICAAAAAVGLPLIPTTGLLRSHAYQRAAAQAIAEHAAGVCIRLTPPEWPTAAGRMAVDDLLTTLGVSVDEVDLVLDVGAEVAAAPGMTLTAVRAEIVSLPSVGAWRSLIVAAAGFPENTSGMGQGVGVVSRTDWLMYQQLVAGRLARCPTFSDYAIAYPDPTLDVDPRLMSISAHLRYTSGAEWLVPKGGLFKGPGGSSLGGSAMVALAPRLVADGGFMASHCAADDWIANPQGGGNPEKWRRVGTLHHLEVVRDQLASLHGP